MVYGFVESVEKSIKQSSELKDSDTDQIMASYVVVRSDRTLQPLISNGDTIKVTSQNFGGLCLLSLPPHTHTHLL